MNLTYEPKHRTIIQDKFNGKSADGSGACCYFVKLNDRVGAKMYRQSFLRDRCWYLQRYAARFKLAPMTGSRFTLHGKDPYACGTDASRTFTYYGFLTQVADMPLVKMYDTYYKMYDEDPVKGTRFFDEIFLKEQRRAEMVVEKGLKEIGLVDGDFHSYNVGFVRGRWVNIDFSFTRVCTPSRRGLRPLHVPAHMRPYKPILD